MRSAAAMQKGVPVEIDNANNSIKNGRQRYVEWSRESTSLTKQVGMLERDLAQGFYGTRTNMQQEAALLRGRKREDTVERLTEVREVKKRLEAQKATMLTIEFRIQRVAGGLDDAEDLDVVMEGLEDQLYGFKCTMRKDYDVLVSKERELNQQVDDLRSMVKEWEKNSRVNPHADGAKRLEEKSTNKTTDEAGKNGNGPSVNRGKSVPGDGDKDVGFGTDQGGAGMGYGDAVERLNALIAREGGAAGGWPQHEHECFLRLWTQARRGPSTGARPPASSPADRAAVSSLVQRAATLLPTKGAEDIYAHLAWHERYLGYMSEKKRLAKEWRERKQMAIMTEGEKMDEVAPSDGGLTRAERDRARVEALFAEEERERKRKEVERWRAAKATEERKRREQQEQEQAVQGAKIDEAKHRQRRIHEQVAAYRMEKEREDSRRREVERMLAREHRRFSQADLEARVKQDVENARQRRHQSSAKSEERQAEEHRRKTAASERWTGVAADRARLLRATKASRERVLEAEDLDDLEDARAARPAHRTRVPMNGRDMRFVGRAVPAWRRGIK